MNKRIKRIIHNCITLIDKGYSTEYCLKKYGRYGKEVEDYLESITSIRELKNVGLDRSHMQRSLGEVLKRAEKGQGTSRAKLRKSSVIQSAYYPPRRSVLKPALIFIILLVLAVFSFSGTLFASQNSIPGETLYPLKRSFEDFRLLVYPESKKGDLHFKYLNNRIDEATVLIKSADETDLILLEGLFEDIDEQYGFCKQYGRINSNNEEEVLNSINQIRNRYREKFGKGPENIKDTGTGDTSSGDNIPDGNNSENNGPSSTGSGDGDMNDSGTGYYDNDSGSKSEKHDNSSKSQGKK